MVWVTYIGKRILRNPGAGLALLCVPLVMVVLLSWLSGAVEQQKSQLVFLYDELPITCEVADLRGDTGRPIVNTYINMLTHPAHPLSAYAKDVLCRRTLQFGRDEEFIELIGLNAWAASDAFLMGSEESIEYWTSFSKESLRQAFPAVWVPRVWLTQSGFSLGDHLTLTISDPAMDGQAVGSLTETFVIAGTHIAATQAVFVPWEVVCTLSMELTGMPYYTEILRFTLSDNRQLAEFKADAAKYFSEIDISGTPQTARAQALVIHDEHFRNSLLSTKRTIRIMEILVPLFFVLALFAGFLTGFLFARSRRREFFLLRCLGIRPGAVIWMTMTEQALFSALGALAGLPVALALWGGTPSFALAGLLTACFAAGTFISVFVLLHTSLMRQREE